jgi:serine protease AprX
MNRTLKVFCSGATRAQLGSKYDVIAEYQAFVLVRVKPRDVRLIARQYPVEDISDRYSIRLPESTVDTSRPRVDARGKVRAHRAYGRGERLTPGRHHYLVQFVGPIKPAWLRAVRREGGEPRAPFADFTYIVRADARSAGRIAALSSVRWVGHYPHQARVAPSALGRRPTVPGTTVGVAPLPRSRVRQGVYTVQFFGADDLRAARSAVRRLGFAIRAADLRGKLLVIEATEPAATRRLERLAKVHGVRSIMTRHFKRPSNDVATGIMNTVHSMGTQGLGLSGKGEVMGICDTGLDTGVAGTIHPAFANRVASIKSYPISPDFDSAVSNPGADDGPADVDSGHGTHVAGSVLGNGAGTAGLLGLKGLVRGLAYQARLAFQAVEQALEWRNPAYLQKYGRYILAGLPLDLSTLFADAYGKGVRIHSNSWGGGDPGAYDAQCEQLDHFVWDHPDFCIVVAAGNDGTDADGDGKINPMSVSSPGTAKNCITVGACENLRRNFDVDTYGDWWPNDYPVAPFRTDPMADNPREVAPFSSRGPTQDGRIKPDVVAPGTFILSTRSTQIALNNSAWAAFPPSKLYFHMGGTSMATPLTAGAVALVRQYLRTKRRIAQPSAALLKATVIAGATRLRGYAPSGTMLDNHQGCGRVNLDAVLAPAQPSSSRFIDVTPGLQTGELRAIDVVVKSSAVPLRVVLAYSDYPGAALVNDLNMIVHSPSGRIYSGNQAAEGTLRTDNRNNVEVVHVARPATGQWRIEIVGSNVPQGPQPYALVRLGHF